ncbi:VP3 [Zetapolyomavirus delphini]|nr:VP3 [Zetapolyomavirus delphini]AGR44741.1 VP3 [Zetapolyomavirus delphini]
MALVEWRPELIDYNFPGVRWLARNVEYFDPRFWASELWRVFMESVAREGAAQIEAASTALAEQGRSVAADAIARSLENANWVISETGALARRGLDVTGALVRQAGQRAVQSTGSIITNAYTNLGDYYRGLTPLRPPQRRAMLRELEKSERQQTITGEVVYKAPAPGGANQRITPEWMLPLILGLYNHPTWGVPDAVTALKSSQEKEENVSKKRKRSCETTQPGAKTNCKRRRRSTRR